MEQFSGKEEKPELSANTLDEVLLWLEAESAGDAVDLISLEELLNAAVEPSPDAPEEEKTAYRDHIAKLEAAANQLLGRADLIESFRKRIEEKHSEAS